MTDSDLNLALGCLWLAFILHRLASRLFRQKYWMEQYIGRLREDSGRRPDDLERARAHLNFMIGFLIVVAIMSYVFITA